MRRYFYILMALTIMVCSVTVSGAFAGKSVGSNSTATNSGSNWVERLKSVPEFKFENHEYGIGYGNCPVYTAPDLNSFRGANGKASCDTNAYMSEAGFVSGWLLVRYETNNGGYRVGYIPPSNVRGFKSQMPAINFDYIPATAESTIYVSDNPKLTGSYYATLAPDETFHVLGKYTYYGDWWYIECDVDGKTARGFIDRGTSLFNVDGQEIGLGDLNPVISPLGTTQIGWVRVTDTERKGVRKNADPNSDRVASADPGVPYACYAVKSGTTGRDWYYIWVEADSEWGWISSGVSTFSY